jgi:PAS domain S-box-containing protein
MNPKKKPRRHPRSLRTYLLVFGLALLLPALGLGAASAWQVVRAYQGAAEGRLLDTARALALALNSEFETYRAAAIALASSPSVRLAPDEGVAALRPWASALAEGLGGARIVINDAAPGYRQLLNTRRPEDAPPPPPAQPGQGAWDLISRVIETGEPAISDLFLGRTSGELLVGIAAPVLRDGRVERVVVIAVDPSRLSALLLRQSLAGEAFASVADRHGRIVARSRDHERFLGTVPPSLRAAPLAAQLGIFRSPTSYGFKGVYAREALLNAAGWTVVVVEPLAAHRAVWLRPLLGLGLGAVLVLALAVATAAAMARMILSPIRSLRQQADAVAEGGPADALVVAAPPARVAEFDALWKSISQASAALRAGETEFRAAFEQSAVPMQQTDCRTGRFLRVNLAFCRLLGRPADELVGRRFVDVTHPDDCEADLVGFWRMACGETQHYEAEKRFIRPDGSVRRVHIASSPIKDEQGRPMRTIAVLQDITERSETEEANARLAAIVTSTADAIISFAAEDGHILSWNQGAKDLFGYDEAEAVGRPASLLVPPELPEADPKGVFRWALEGRRVYQYETVRVAKCGERIPVSITATRILAPDERVLGVSGIFRDLRSQRAAEARQKLLMREVDHRAKNALAVVQAALKLTPKDDPEAYAKAVGGRVTALARAHTLLAEGRWTGADFRTLAAAELAPFLGSTGSDEAEGRQPRVDLNGPALVLAPEAVQALSMVVHELATNAVKHGALSASGGQVWLSWRIDESEGDLHLWWAERGGPAIEAPPERRGFGSRVLEAIVCDQLGGGVSRAWECSGLVCKFRVPLARVLTRSTA